jgi:hypothetical protein
MILLKDLKTKTNLVWQSNVEKLTAGALGISDSDFFWKPHLRVEIQ